MAFAECSQCGLEAPFDAAELSSWRHGELALEGDVGEGLLVCPDCDAQDRERASRKARAARRLLSAP